LVPPLVALVVIPACAVLAEDRIRVGVVIVAVVTTATSSWCERRPAPRRIVAAIAMAVGTAGVVAQLAITLPRTVDGVVVGALVAGVAFEVIALLLAPDRRRRAVVLAWMAPIVATAVAGAAVWRNVGARGALVVAILASASLLGWAAWGAPAWRSRVSRRVAAPAAILPSMWMVLAALALGASIAAVSLEHTAAVGWAWTAAGVGEVVIAMTAAGVRQWRFAPGSRRIGLATAIVASALLVGAGAPLVARGSVWGPVVVAATLCAVGAVARVPARRLHDEQRARRIAERAR
jgi:hypothetical protein